MADNETVELDDNDLLLIGVVDGWSKDISELAEKKGFWEQAHISYLTSGDRDKVEAAVKAQKLMLMVSELGEALEGIRKPGISEKLGEGFTQEEEELADLLIRLLDYAGHYKLRLGEATVYKHLYNAGRPYKHGKAF